MRIEWPLEDDDKGPLATGKYLRVTFPFAPEALLATIKVIRSPKNRSVEDSWLLGYLSARGRLNYGIIERREIE